MKVCCTLKAGAMHVNTTVLGIGGRNGIMSLGGLIACLIVADGKYIMSMYRINQLGYIKNLVVWAIQNGHCEKHTSNNLL